MAQRHRGRKPVLLLRVQAHPIRTVSIPTSRIVLVRTDLRVDFYTWTRDSALTFKYLISAYTNGNSSLNTLIEDYILAQGRVQVIKSPSGDFSTGGLGEPKFYVNETAFEGDWGRPQHDGPALRASTMIAYSNSLLSSGKNATVRDIIWPLISNDLNYVTQNWNHTGFDLWEEVNGSSIFTTAMQYRALVEGSALAQKLNESCENCDSQSPQVLCFLQNSYWNFNHSIANINLAQDNGRGGLDCAAILTANHLFDAEATCDVDGYQPCQGRALANHKAVVDSMRGIYTINTADDSDAKTPGKPVAIGRYAEDVYYDGNPWFLCTSAAAEQLYKAIYQWSSSGSVVVDDVSKAFFQDLVHDISAGTWDKSTNQFTQITNAAKIYADGFANIVKKHAGTNGSIAEQISRENGTMVSASDLTWSYAAFLTMADARAGGKVLDQETWGWDAVKVPDSCKASSATGDTTTPNPTQFPDGQGSSENGTSGSAAGTPTPTGGDGSKPTGKSGATAVTVTTMPLLACLALAVLCSGAL